MRARGRGRKGPSYRTTIPIANEESIQKTEPKTNNHESGTPSSNVCYECHKEFSVMQGIHSCKNSICTMCVTDLIKSRLGLNKHISCPLCQYEYRTEELALLNLNLDSLHQVCDSSPQESMNYSSSDEHSTEESRINNSIDDLQLQTRIPEGIRLPKCIFHGSSKMFYMCSICGNVATNYTGQDGSVKLRCHNCIDKDEVEFDGFSENFGVCLAKEDSVVGKCLECGRVLCF